MKALSAVLFVVLLLTPSLPMAAAQGGGGSSGSGKLPVLFVHDMVSPLSNWILGAPEPNGAAEGYDVVDYFRPLEPQGLVQTLTSTGWEQEDIVFVRYYGCDRATFGWQTLDVSLFGKADTSVSEANHRAINRPEIRGIADGYTLDHRTARASCGGPSDDPAGHSTATDIRHLSYHFAWAVYRNYQTDSPGSCVDVIAHGIGGLIVHHALQQVEDDAADYPPVLCIREVITFSTPFAGMGEVRSPVGVPLKAPGAIARTYPQLSEALDGLDASGQLDTDRIGIARLCSSMPDPLLVDAHAAPGDLFPPLIRSGWYQCSQLLNVRASLGVDPDSPPPTGSDIAGYDGSTRWTIIGSGFANWNPLNMLLYHASGLVPDYVPAESATALTGADHRISYSYGHFVGHFDWFGRYHTYEDTLIQTGRKSAPVFWAKPSDHESFAIVDFLNRIPIPTLPPRGSPCDVAPILGDECESMVECALYLTVTLGDASTNCPDRFTGRILSTTPSPGTIATHILGGVSCGAIPDPHAMGRTQVVAGVAMGFLIPPTKNECGYQYTQAGATTYTVMFASRQPQAQSPMRFDVRCMDGSRVASRGDAEWQVASCSRTTSSSSDPTTIETFDIIPRAGDPRLPVWIVVSEGSFPLLEPAQTSSPMYGSSSPVTLRWSTPGATAAPASFLVERRVASAAAEDWIGVLVPNSARSFIDEKAVAGATYDYRVRPMYPPVRGPVSNEITVTTPSSLGASAPKIPPAPPIGVHATESGDSIIVAWKPGIPPEKSPSVTHYKILLDEPQDPMHLIATVDEILPPPSPTDERSYTIPNARPRTAYHIYVAASNADGLSHLSWPADLVKSGTPDAPGDLVVTKPTSAYTVTWSAPADGGSTIQLYKVYRNDAFLKDVPGTQLTTTDEPSAPGSYVYALRAQNALGLGLLSAKKEYIPTPPPPPAPSPTMYIPPLGSEPVVSYLRHKESFTNANDMSNWTAWGPADRTFERTCSDSPAPRLDGCYLLVRPGDSTSFSGASRAGLNIPVAGRTVISTRFLATAPGGGTELTWTASFGDTYSMETTINYGRQYGYPGRLYVNPPGTSADGQYGPWASTNVWYEIRHVIDTVEGRTWAELRGPDGALISSSTKIALGPTPGNLTSLSFRGTRIGAGGAFAFDDMQVAHHYQQPRNDDFGHDLTGWEISGPWPVHFANVQYGDGALVLPGHEAGTTTMRKPVWFAASNDPVFSVRLAGDPPAGSSTDWWVTMGGHKHSLHLTDPWSGNNRGANFCIDSTCTGVFGGRPFSGLEYEMRIVESQSDLMAWAEIRQADGTLVAASPRLDVRGHLRDITELGFTSTKSTTGGTGVSIDRMRVTGGIGGFHGPTVPQSLTATLAADRVSLNWQPPETLGGTQFNRYDVYRYARSTGNFQPQLIGSTSSVDATTFVDASPPLREPTVYTIQTVAREGLSRMSNGVVEVPYTRPDPPTSLAASPGNGWVRLTWSPPASDGGRRIDHYEVLCDGIEVGSTRGASIEIAGLTNGVLSSYAVRTVTETGARSGPGPALSAMSVGPPSVMSAPTATRGDHRVDLSWTSPPSTGGSAILRYDIFRGTSPDFTLDAQQAQSVTGLATSHTDTTAENGVTYWYRIVAQNAIGASPPSAATSAKPARVPDAPQNVTLTRSGEGLVVKWDAPPFDGGEPLTGYEVHRSTTPGFTPSASTRDTPSATSPHTTPSLSLGTRYYVKVLARNALGSTASGPEATALPAIPPSAPVSATATRDDSQIRYAWGEPTSAGGSAPTHYLLWIAESCTASGTTVPVVGNVINVTGLKNGQTYCARLRAVNAAGNGTWSADMLAKPAAVPEPVKNVTLTPDGDRRLRLAWQPSFDGGESILQYRVHASTDPNMTPTLDNLAGSTTEHSFMIAGLDARVKYHVRIIATNVVGDGYPSPAVNATTTTLPGAPTGLIATHGDGHVSLRWSAPASDGGTSLVSYNIYRGATSGATALIGTTGGPNTTFVVNGLANGQAYFFNVAAVNSNGQSAKSNEASATPSTIPDAPTALTPTHRDGSVSLTWTAPANDGKSAITNYQIYVGTTATRTFHASTGGPNTTFTVNGLANGQAYLFNVTAMNVNGQSASSNVVGATPSRVPDAPIGLSATRGDRMVTLAWTAPVSNGGSSIANYNVYRGTASGGAAFLGSTGGPNTTWISNGLTNGVAYYYHVTAVNTNGQSVTSDEVTATPSTVPSAPTGLLGTKGNTSVSLAWSAPATNGGSGVTEYYVYRGTSSGNEVYFASTGGTNTTFVVNGLVNGQSYFFKVSAVNANGPSTGSTEISVTPSTIPYPPAGLSGSGGNGTIAISWSAPTNDGGSAITNYHIYRGTSSDATTYVASTGGTDRSFVMAGLINGQTYYFRVAALNADGQSATSSVASARPSTVPGAPTGFDAAKGNATVSLTWIAPGWDGGSDLTSYDIFRGTATGATTFLSSTGGLNTSFVSTGLTNGETYFYQVRAVNSNGRSVGSNEARATPSTIPYPPAGLMATYGNGSVSLSWTAPVNTGGSQVVDYQIYVGTTTTATTYLASTGGPNTTFVVNRLANGQSYFFNVTARNANGQSAGSNEATAIPATVPSEPTDLVVRIGDRSVALSWAPPADDGGRDVARYRILRDGAVVGETTTTAMSEHGLAARTIYHYEVRAISEVGPGPAASVDVAVITVPEVPATLSARAFHNEVELTWSPPQDEGGARVSEYIIARRISGQPVVVINWTPTFEKPTWIDATPSSGQAYEYRVSAVNKAGVGDARTVFATPNEGSPTPPLNVRVALSGGQPTITWLPPRNTGGSSLLQYNVLRTVGAGSSTLVCSVPASQARTCTDSTSTSGADNTYHVIALNQAGLQSGSSSREHVVPAAGASPPGAITGMTVTRAIDPQGEEIPGALRLGWSAPSSAKPISFYKLYRAPVGSTPVYFANVTATSYVDLAMRPDMAYSYRVAAVSSAGEALPSNTGSATPRLDRASAPLGLSAWTTSQQVRLTWEPPADTHGHPVLAYRIHRVNGSGTPTDIVASVDALSFTDTNITSGASYRYRVTAVTEMGASEPSPVIVASAVNLAPNVPSVPGGNSSALLSVTSVYTTNATDPNGDDITMTFDWGDGTNTTTPRVANGHPTSAGHAWSRVGSFCVRARAADEDRAVSAWSACRTVVVSDPNDPDPSTPTVQNGLAVQTRIETTQSAYYKIRVPAGAVALNVTTREVSCTLVCLADGDLALRSGARPNETRDCYSDAPASSDERCTVTAPIPGWWYIKVNNIGVAGTIRINATYTVGLFDDDFESGADRWSVTDAGGAGSWGVTAQRARSPAHSFGIGGTSGYSAGSDDSITTSIDLRGMRSATLTFWHWANGECAMVGSSCVTPIDFGRVEVSTNGGSSWSTLGSGYWSTNGFQAVALPMDAQVGQQVLLRFRWSSSLLVQNEGWYVDDVRVMGAPD